MRSILLALILIASSALASDADLSPELNALENRWAITKYEISERDQRLANVQALHLEADGLVDRYPGRAEPLIWQALIFILEGEVRNAAASLGVLRRALQLLEEAEGIDGSVMNGAVHAHLGSLYYEVPGWPISFGSNAKAESHLLQALAHDRDGREANFFYGDYLLQLGRPGDALPYLEKAVKVPIDPAHLRAARGRRGEAAAALAQARAALR